MFEKKLVCIGAVALCFAISTHAMRVEIDGKNAQPNTSAVSQSCSLYGKQSFTSTGGLTQFTSEHAYSGSVGLKMTAPAGETGFGPFGGIVEFSKCNNNKSYRMTKGDEIWVRTRIMVPSTWQWNSGRNKFFRFRTYYDNSGSKVSIGYNDLYIDGHPEREDYHPFQFIYEGEHNWFGVGSKEDFFKPGKWQTVEMYLRLDDKKRSQGGNSIVRVWVDGRLVGETYERITLARPDAYIDSFSYFTYYGNETSPKTQSLYVDDLIITDERPNSFDAQGNRYIGLGDAEAMPSAPNPPENIRIRVQ